jgi:NAD(P)-dependent dehydrogenase (short-subunit alcohol dehydrogenase family)
LVCSRDAKWKFRLTALITGASSGIGTEIAIQLGPHGAYAIIHYHNNLCGATEALERVRRYRGDGEHIAAGFLHLH